MYSNTFSHTTQKKVPEVKIIFLHLFDIIVGGGLLGFTILNIDDWQAAISLSILVMFAGLRGVSMLEDIKTKRETRETLREARRKAKIENDHQEWELHQKRNP